jgi:hypothetical protein
LRAQTRERGPPLACASILTTFGERKRERENNTVNRGHYVCHAANLQRQTGRARTTLGPKSAGIKVCGGWSGQQ